MQIYDNCTTKEVTVAQFKNGNQGELQCWPPTVMRVITWHGNHPTPSLSCSGKMVEDKVETVEINEEHYVARVGADGKYWVTLPSDVAYCPCNHCQDTVELASKALAAIELLQDERLGYQASSDLKEKIIKDAVTLLRKKVKDE